MPLGSLRGEERALLATPNGQGLSITQGGGGHLSQRRKVSHFLVLVVIAALTVGLMAGPAEAKKMSAKQKSKITRQLKKAVKHNPRVVNKRWFLKKASRGDFK